MTDAASFAKFLAGLHGRDAFEWQDRAASELAGTGWWNALRAPTGAGKTTLIECWLWALAQSGPDLLGRRLLWVVDRRAVIDQIHAHAELVLTRLLAPDADDAVQRIAKRLIELGGGQPPRASLWRGGLDDEANIEMRTPLDPASVAIISSTVDQVGSRLLFRGYGLTHRSRALHAGLLGVDSTLVLDEAHLAGPFLQTAGAIGAMQAAATQSPRPALRTCAVSATIEHEGAFELSDEELTDPPIAQRTRASKITTLVESSGPSAAVKAAREASGDGAMVIGIVMNTVGDARRAFEALASATCQEMEDRVLLIGPVRPLDRMDLIDRIPSRAERGTRDSPFFAVATQTIEVGVDLDFDALITACAPLSSLVQRLGRLDRGGRVGKSPAWILAPPKADPVYGPDATAAWEWLLQARGDADTVDLGVSAIAELRSRMLDPDTTDEPSAPILQAAHVRALEVTDAREDEGPEIEVLLRGPREPSADVSILWRADVPDDPDATAAVRTSLARRPAHTDEALTVSVAAARRWISRRKMTALGDVTTSIASKFVDSDPRAQITAWRIDPIAGEPLLIRDTRDLRPGDRMIVTSESGGTDGFGWDPDRDPDDSGKLPAVDDLGSIPVAGQAVVVGDELSDRAGPVHRWAERLLAGDATPDEPAATLRAAITRSLPDLDPDRPQRNARITECIEALAGGMAAPVDGDRLLISSRSVRSTYDAAGAAAGLAEHQAQVALRAEAAADALRLLADVRLSIRRAAAHHDEGKRDERFQAWLQGGRPSSGSPLAKSSGNTSRARRRALRIAAGWPASKRHELLSAVGLAAAYPNDELAPWLGVTHHGLNRPWPQAVHDPAGDVVVRLWLDAEDPNDVSKRIAIDLPAGASPDVAYQLDRLSTLGERFGPWGLAFLEAIVVTADGAISSGKCARR